MPELPETETIARDLDAELRGATITGARVHRADVLREVDAATLAARVRGSRIARVWRRAKLVILDLRGATGAVAATDGASGAVAATDGGDHGQRLVVQPRFTGALLLDAGDLPERERPFLRVSFDLADGRVLHYRDIRCLGTVALMDATRFAAYAGALGPEPLDPAFTPAQLSASLRGSRQAVKKLLMDQRRLVGVGNIYANEALWRAGVRPDRPGQRLREGEVVRLHAGLRDVLTESIALRGTSFRDYVDARGARGRFVERLAVYGRGGEPCVRCGRELTTTHEIDGRATVYCGKCQR